MVILVSDLHLADTDKATTIHSIAFVQQLKRMIAHAAEHGIGSVHLVLLGDIFEILKSKRWLNHGVRPWEISTPAHVTVVDAIVEGIISSNMDFFRGIQEISEGSDPKVRLNYVPGNHDLPLNTLMGASARARLQRFFPMPTDDHFEPYFVSEEYKLLAKHGHEWDPVNRYGDNGAAIGDAIVIDLLLRLPQAVAQKLGLEEWDPALMFLQEIDNVRPQHPKVIAQWVIKGMSKADSQYPDLREAFEEACTEVLEEFQRIQIEAERQGIRFESFRIATIWIRVLMAVARKTVSRVGVLRAARLIPTFDDNIRALGEFAVDDLSTLRQFGFNCKYLVSGHTHWPELIPLNSGDCGNQGAPLYLNAGTWRRVHRMGATIKPSDTMSCFATWDEQCVITIFSEEEQRKLCLPAYEFHRSSRGIDV